MSLQKYEAFLKIVDCGGVTKAASELGYTQPGISHMLNSLESEFGTNLLIRDRLGVRLTSDGARLLPFIRNVCNSQRELLGAVTALRGLESGVIRIGAFSSVAVNWLPHMIVSFHREYPKIDFELLYGDYTSIENWVLEGRVDCGFLRLPAREGLESLFLEEDRLMVILPENHPEAACDYFPIEKLSEERFILLAEGKENEIMEIFEELRVTPKVCFTAWDNHAIAAMVESGLGISILPELALRRTPCRIVKKELSKPYYRKLGLVLRSIQNASLAMRRFLGYLYRRSGDL